MWVLMFLRSNCTRVDGGFIRVVRTAKTKMKNEKVFEHFLLFLSHVHCVSLTICCETASILRCKLF